VVFNVCLEIVFLCFIHIIQLQNTMVLHLGPYKSEGSGTTYEVSPRSSKSSRDLKKGDEDRKRKRSSGLDSIGADGKKCLSSEFNLDKRGRTGKTPHDSEDDKSTVIDEDSDKDNEEQSHSEDECVSHLLKTDEYLTCAFDISHIFMLGEYLFHHFRRTLKKLSQGQKVENHQSQALPQRARLFRESK